MKCIWTSVAALGLLSSCSSESTFEQPPGVERPAVESRKPDLNGSPDMIVREDMLREWLIQTETFAASDCSTQEGGVTPGDHRVLRFTVGTANIGNADQFIGSPLAHWNAGDDLFELSACHDHFHFRHFALYELIGANGSVWRSAKRGFCMVDTDRNPTWLGGPRGGPKLYENCGTLTHDGYQGVSAGWTDTYHYSLDGQYFMLDGGDGQPVVPAGSYTLRVTVNPPFISQPGEPCPHADTHGFCHQLPESNYDNNTAEMPISIGAP